jgi:hypothetical protein
MNATIKSKEEIQSLLNKLGNQLFNIENYYLIYSELGLHYNKQVNEDAAKAYLKVINSEKGFFIPVQNALRSALTVELNSFIVSEDAESLRSAIRYLKELEGAPDLTSNYSDLKKKNANIMTHLADFRNKYYAHKSGQDLSKLTASSDKEFQELFADIKELFNKAGAYFGQAHWFMDRDSREAVSDTHNMMNNLLRGEAQRVSEIDVEYIDGVFEDGRRKWMADEKI